MSAALDTAPLVDHLATLSGEEAAQFLQRVKMQAALKVEPGSGLRPLALDFDALPEPPDWVVHGVVERGTVAMLSGDTGAAKSIVSQWLCVCALKGEEWLGRRTSIARVLVVDEENPDGLVRARLRAMGLTNAEREGLRYFSREGLTLGDPRTDALLDAEIASFGPDLIVIDTLMSASAVDVNDNSEAVAMMKRLRATAREHGCAVLLLHHERKTQRDGPVSGSGQQAMGARQWLGQSDATLTIAVESDMQREEMPDGGFKLRRTFKMRPAEKDRDGRLNGTRRIAVESEKDDRERLLSMTVADEGPITQATAKDDDARSILIALRDAGSSMGRKDIAAATAEPDPLSPSGTWKTALSDLLDAGKIEKDGARYTITDEGRAAAGLEV